MIVLINRGDYFQCGYIVRKGSFETHIQPAASISSGVTSLSSSPSSTSRTPTATPASPSSPTGRSSSRSPFRSIISAAGIVPACSASATPPTPCRPSSASAINLAIQDAVAAANLLVAPLRQSLETGFIPERALARVQRRRALAVRLTQGAQILVHGFLNRYLGSPRPLRAPLFPRLATRFAWIRHLVGRFIGMGLRPEHVRALPQPAPARNARLTASTT